MKWLISQCSSSQSKFEVDVWVNFFGPGGVGAFGLKVYACDSG